MTTSGGGIKSKSFLRLRMFFKHLWMAGESMVVLSYYHTTVLSSRSLWTRSWWLRTSPLPLMYRWFPRRYVSLVPTARWEDDDFIKLICFFTINTRQRRTTTISKSLRERCRPDRFFLNEDECYLFLFICARACLCICKNDEKAHLSFLLLSPNLGFTTLILFSLTNELFLSRLDLSSLLKSRFF